MWPGFEILVHQTFDAKPIPNNTFAQKNHSPVKECNKEQRHKTLESCWSIGDPKGVEKDK